MFCNFIFHVYHFVIILFLTLLICNSTGHWRVKEYAENCIEGYNTLAKPGLSPSECAFACLTETSIVCRSFDTHPDYNGVVVCNLSEEWSESVPASYQQPCAAGGLGGWTYYEREYVI